MATIFRMKNLAWRKEGKGGEREGRGGRRGRGGEGRGEGGGYIENNTGEISHQNPK